MSLSKTYLVCESLKLGGVQSFYLRLAETIGGSLSIISLTELTDSLFVSDLEQSDVNFFTYSKLTHFGMGTKRATLCNSIPLSTKRLKDEFSSPVLYFHVSSLSGAVMVHRITRILGKKYSVKLTIGIYNGLIFGWKSAINSYYSKLSTEILKGFFGSKSVLFTNEQSKLIYEKKINFKCQSELMPVGIFQPQFIKRKLISNNRKKIVSIGRVVEYKTYNKNVIYALRALISSGLDCEFHVYGNGDYIEKLRQLVKKLSLDGYVFFNGLVKYKDLPSVFETADVFVGCGTTLIEAASYGVPSIIGIENMVESKTYGFLTETKGYSFHEKGLNYDLQELEQKLKHVLTLRDTEYQELSQQHISRARDFSIETSVKTLKAIFEKVDSYDVHNGLSVTRLQVSIIMEQMLAKVGLNQTYRTRLNDAQE